MGKKDKRGKKRNGEIRETGKKEKRGKKQIGKKEMRKKNRK